MYLGAMAVRSPQGTISSCLGLMKGAEQVWNLFRLIFNSRKRKKLPKQRLKKKKKTPPTEGRKQICTAPANPSLSPSLLEKKKKIEPITNLLLYFPAQTSQCFRILIFNLLCSPFLSLN